MSTLPRYKLFCQSPGGEQREITRLVQSLTWSGELRQVARQLNVTVAAPEAGVGLTLPALGDALLLQADGDACFTGTLVRRARGSTQTTVDLLAMDGGWRLAQNKGYYSFRAVSAADAAAMVCRDFNIPVGQLAQGGGVYSRKFAGVSLDKIIGTMYSFASEDSGARYLVRFDAYGSLEVVQKPLEAVLEIAPRVNSMGISITEDMSKMATLVSIYSDDGKLLRSVQGEAYTDFGLSLQHIITQRKGEDAGKEAEAFLEDNGLSQSITAEALGDTRLRTGNAVLLRENRSGALGLCWIESDTHTFKNGQYFCKLKLNFKNLMNSEKGGSEVK